MAADRSEVSNGLYMTEEQYLTLDEATELKSISVRFPFDAVYRRIPI